MLTLFTFGSIFWSGFNAVHVWLHYIRDKPTVITLMSQIGVYKHWPLNVLEFSFLVNLGIVSGLVYPYDFAAPNQQCDIREIYFTHVYGLIIVRGLSHRLLST